MVNAIDLLLNSQSTSLRIQNCVSRWNAKKIWCFLSHKKPRTLQGKQRTFPDKSFSIFKSIWWIVHVLCCIFKCSKFYSSLFEEVIFFPTFVLICLSCLSPSFLVCAVSSDSLQPTRLLCPWDSPGKNTAAGCHLLLQGIFSVQGLNPHLLHW